MQCTPCTGHLSVTGVTGQPFTPMVNSESPVNLSPLIYLCYGRKPEYPVRTQKLELNQDLLAVG